MKDFTKNQKVTRIINWDRKGTFVYQDAVVYSCGHKQMVLTDEVTGEEIGRHFSPLKAEVGAEGTYPRLTVEEATEICLDLAAKFLDSYRAGDRKRIENTPGQEGYHAALRREEEKLHEPEAMSHQEACERIKASA